MTDAAHDRTVATGPPAGLEDEDAPEFAPTRIQAAPPGLRDEPPLPPAAPQPPGNEKTVAREVPRGLRELAALDAPVDLTGATVGEYVIDEQIGSGGVGIVYRAHNPEIQRQVAIKVLRAEAAGDPQQVRRLLSEARAVNGIRHRGIVDVFSMGKLPDGRPYLVMELLVGEPLDAVLAKRGRLPVGEALGWLDELLSALAAAHAQGIIHRDLKPNNVFIARQADGSRYLKLLDFGMAKNTSPSREATGTHRTLIVGTPQYMSPEQISGNPVSPQSDLYSVGVLAFQMLTGKLPFEGTTPFSFLMHHLETDPTLPTHHVPELPPGLEGLLLQLLAKDPKARPASADEVRSRLRVIFERSQAKPARVASPLDRPPLSRTQSTDRYPAVPPAASEPTPVTADPLRSRAATAGQAEPTPVNTRAVPAPRAADRTKITPIPVRSRPLTRVLLGGAALALALVTGWVTFRSPSPEPPQTNEFTRLTQRARGDGFAQPPALAPADAPYDRPTLRRRIRRLRNRLEKRTRGRVPSGSEQALLDQLEAARASLRVSRTASERRQLALTLDVLEAKVDAPRN